jgi:uncharacterized repeat protein (TIGR03803 family)
MRTLLLLSCSALLAGCSREGLGAMPDAVHSSVASHALHRYASSRANVTFNILYEFQGDPDGAQPWATMTDVNGTLYGTTTTGGASNAGSVFSIAPSGTETLLYSFKGSPDGAQPYGTLVDVNGTLYGTTGNGGASGAGTVYSLTPSGAESVLYSFKGGSDGGGPNAGLTHADGVLYGTTVGGGSGCKPYNGCGTVFAITTSGKERVLYRFKGSREGDGANPRASMIDVGGSLYGTTVQGGVGGGGDCKYAGCGTVFKVSRSGAESVVYRFEGKDNNDGAYPASPLIDVGGWLYGTTVNYGLCGGDIRYCGIVYKVTPTPPGYEVVVHYFQGPDGLNPYAGLINLNGTLYGTTAFGGANYYECDCGSVYEISPSTGEETVLYSFTGGSDGGGPVAGLTAVNGTLYGATYGGGTYGYGTLFSISP